jgi:ubiquinone/menaquinone biosynthesis C-methylase UbiE
MKRFLHVGCGAATKANITLGFNTDSWQEVRFDIDPACAPDIIGTIIDMSGVADASVDAIYSSHCIEHIYPHEVPHAISEFARVLSEDGFVVLTCPDLQTVCEAVAQDKLLDTVYVSPAGPIAPIDILFGHRPSIAAGKHHMAHKSGFTLSVLAKAFSNGGFKSVFGRRRAQSFDLWIIAYKQPKAEPEISVLARQYLP